MSENTVVISKDIVARPEPVSSFPGSVRVLAIDDNPVCLRVLACGLRKCGYQVTATTKATEALEMLRSNKDDYDIVITDVVRADIDGFKLLEIIGLEMDIPVIMTSANGDKIIQYKGLHHGARDYLVKPVKLEHLRTIWRHVHKKNVDNLKSDPVRGEEVATKHKEKSINKEDEKNNRQNRGNSASKNRISWTPDLHKKFVDAVQLLGVDEAVPKRILEAMNEPDLTREHVASHLQKYRISLRKQKGIIGHKHATTTTTLTDTHPPMLNSLNKSRSCMKNEGRGVDMVSFRGSQSSWFRPPKQHEISLQQNMFAIKMESQMRPIPISVHSNATQGSFLPANRHDFNAKMPPEIYSGRKMVGDYTGFSSVVPSFSPGQSFVGSFSPALGNQALFHRGPYSYSPCAFNDFGAPYPMYGDSLTQRTPVIKADYSALHIPNPLTGLQEEKGLLTNGETTGYSVDLRGEIDVTKGNDQMATFLELLLNDSEMESNYDDNSFIFP